MLLIILLYFLQAQYVSGTTMPSTTSKLSTKKAS